MTLVDPHAEALYRDASAPVPERVADLLHRMTVEEKLAQLGSAWSFTLLEGGRFAPARARSSLPTLATGEPSGFSYPPVSWASYGRDMAYTVEPGSIEVHLGFSSDALVHVGTRAMAVRSSTDAR